MGRREWARIATPVRVLGLVRALALGVAVSAVVAVVGPVHAAGLGQAAAVSATAVSATAGEWCANFGPGAGWDAASATCTVSGPEVTLTADVEIEPDETLYVTSDVQRLVLDAAVTNYGAAAVWALDTEARGRIFNYGVLAAVGTFDNYGDFWNYQTLRIFETFTNYGVITNEGTIEGAVASSIHNLGSISNVRRARFASEGLISNGGTFLAECGATLAYDPASFTGNSILGMTGCDELDPKPTPSVWRAANGDTIVLWNWVDNQGGAGIDVLNCQAITRLRGAVAQDVTVAAVCADRAGNRSRATFVVPAGVVPPACDGRYARVAIQLDPRSALASDVRIWGPKGSFLLDGSSADGDEVPQGLTYTDMLPGVHTFAASVPFGWALGGVSCTPSGKCQVDPAQNSVRITVRACDDVTAVFTVTQRGALRVQTYADMNGDGRRQAEERASGHWWHELAAVAADGSMRLVASGFSGEEGEWTVTGLMPGQEHVVCEKPQAPWTNTQPGPSAADARGWACYRFTLRSGEEAVVTFGQTEGEPQGGGSGIVPRGAGENANGDAGGNSEVNSEGDSGGVEVRQLAPDSGRYLFLPNVAGGRE